MLRLCLVTALLLSSCISIEVNEASKSGRDAPSLTAGPLAFTLMVDAADEGGAVSSEILERGEDYIVQVSGTYSIWGAHYLGRPCRGEPEAAPQFELERQSGPVAMDAAWRFAVPASGGGLCNLPDSSPAPGWQSARSGWRYRLRANDPWTLAPTLMPYEPSHVYRYHLRGLGEPLRVAAVDGAETRDNYGQLRFEVFRTEL